LPAPVQAGRRYTAHLSEVVLNVEVDDPHQLGLLGQPYMGGTNQAGHHPWDTTLGGKGGFGVVVVVVVVEEEEKDEGVSAAHG